MAKRIAAIILAAGCSSRMGEFKPLLPLGEMTILERAIRLFEQAGTEDIGVVVGYRANDLIQLLQKKRISWVLNENYQQGMFSSVKAGIRDLKQAVEAFFVLPVDIPLVRRQSILDLLDIYGGDTGRILYPTFRGRRGHPPLIGAEYREEILHWSGEGGLGSFLEKHESRAVDVEVADECILLDADRPEDYQRLLVRVHKYDIPTEEECMTILKKKIGENKKLIDHCRAVTRVALGLATALNECGCDLDLDLIRAAGLLHDLARGELDHAAVGAEILQEMGYCVVADVVAGHMDIFVQKDEPLSPREIIYLADKLVQGDRKVPMEVRFQQKMKRFSGDPRALEAIASRMASAKKIKSKVEEKLGMAAEEVPPYHAGEEGNEPGDLFTAAW